MDLHDLTFRDTYSHPILHPLTREPVLNKDGSPQWVELYGSDTKQYRNALAEVARLNIEDPTDKLVEFLSRITARWSITAGGNSPKVEDALTVYAALPAWLRDNIFAAAADRANFFGTTSAG